MAETPGTAGSIPRSGDLVASRLVETPGRREIAPAEFENRLGQGFRRQAPRTSFVGDMGSAGK
jgi:hypothetical protein